MKTVFAGLFLLPLFVFSQAKPGFVLSGSVSGFPEGTAVKLVNGNDNSDMAVTKVAGGKFVFKGSVDEAQLCKLAIGDEAPQYVYLENKKITVSGSKSDLQHLKVTGSTAHQDFMTFQKVFGPLIASLNATVASLNKPTQKSQSDALMKTYDSLRSTIQAEIDKFLKSKPKSIISPFMLFVTADMYDDPLLLEKRYNAMDASVQNSSIGKNLYSYIQYNKVGAVGTPALDFTQPDTAGTPVTLSSFRGKYVLVDFWASWCGPCRAENPNVVDNFAKFKNKNFTVLGVSLDRPGGKDNWIAAIHKDNLTWTQVSDLL
ncbi:MAG TPA: TlpA disulfide reductase family protein, partial [Chitinophagaceae bacterium]|nr:TlpA disulfide reductase family protein [Chitinophagaceae bacterium]